MRATATGCSLSLILFVSLVAGCSRRAAECGGPTPSPSTYGASDAAVSDADAAVAPDSTAEMDALSEDADAAPALQSPIRFHLRNDGTGDVYLGLRFIDRCAFDYTVTKLDPRDGGEDAGPSSLIIEPPMCMCRPDCSPQSCYELCDDVPPRIAPGQERVLPGEGRPFSFASLCGGGPRCAAASQAAPARYGLTIPVYDSAVQTMSAGAPARTANVAFDLGGASL